MTDFLTSIEILYQSFKTWHRLETYGIVTRDTYEEICQYENWKSKYVLSFAVLHRGYDCSRSYVIGKGKYAVVFSRDHIAFKVVHLHMKSRKRNTRLRHHMLELCFLNTMFHPNLCKPMQSQMLMTHGKFRGFIYQMPQARQTWLEMIERNEITHEHDVGRIAADVLSALTYLHHYGVCHGDIKPSNVLLAADKAVLTDFNLTTLGAKDGGCSLGTICWRPPECINAPAKYSVASDIWSFGIILLDCLYGCVFVKDVLQVVTSDHLPLGYRAMLTDQKAPEWVHKHGRDWDTIDTVRSRIRNAPHKLQECGDLMKVMAKMLKWDPAQRIKTADLWREPFFQKYAPSVSMCQLIRIDRIVIAETLDPVQIKALWLRVLPSHKPIPNWCVPDTLLLASRLIRQLQTVNQTFEVEHVVSVCVNTLCYLWLGVWPSDNPLFESEMFHVLYLTQFTVFSWYVKVNSPDGGVATGS